MGVDIALQNPGGMRADMDAGPITRGDVYAVMPFDNTILTMDLTGDQVKLALEQALRGSRVTQVSGVRYVVDIKKPPLERITSISLADGKPLDPQHKYKVAVNNFMASGGDQYDALANGANRNDTGRLIRDAMMKWVASLKAAGKSVDLQRDGRITSADGTAE